MLTEKQSILLRYIWEYRYKHGGSPTLREMVAATGAYDTKSVSGIVNALVAKGLLNREKGQFRSIRLTSIAIDMLGLGTANPMPIQEGTISSPFAAQMPSAPHLKPVLERNDATILVSASNDFLANSEHQIRTNSTNMNYWPEAIQTVANIISHLFSNGTSPSIHPEDRRHLGRISRPLIIALSLLPPVIALAGTEATGLLWFAVVYCLVMFFIYLPKH